MAEAKGPSGVSKALNAAWLRPFLFLIFIVVAWDLTIRVFRIPAYQIPAPGDVVAVLWSDWPELLRQAWPTTYATICGFLLSALFGIPVAMLIAGSKTVESYIYPLLVFSQSVPKIAIAPLFVVWFGFGIIPKVISAFLLGFPNLSIDFKKGALLCVELHTVRPQPAGVLKWYLTPKLIG